MESAMVASDAVTTRIRFRTHVEASDPQWSSGHSFFPHKDIFHHIPRPHFVGEDGSIPPCEFLNKHKLPGASLAVFVLALAIFFSIRRIERRGDGLAVCLLDLARQLIATAVSRCFFGFMFKSSINSQDYYSDPIVCRLPVVSYFFGTFIGLPLLYVSHKLIFAVARRISLGRKKYVPKDEIARAGLQSGNYGNPIRFRLVVKQTLLLCSASIFTNSILSFVMYSARSWDSGLEMILLGWTWHMGPGAEKIMAEGVYPLLFWTIQYMMVDRIIRYRPQTPRKSQGDLEAALDRYETDEGAGIEVGDRAHGSATDVPVQEIQNTIALSDTRTSRDLARLRDAHQQYSTAPNHLAPSSAVESSRNLLSRSTPASILTSLLTPSVGASSSMSSGIIQTSATPSIPVAQNTVPASHIPPSTPVHYDPLNSEPGTEDELPTYAEALESRERDRQRLMDLKRH
ncbi:hypothetical protein V1509DRAFT_569200 [Lipomyces kononenkoae]